MGRELTRNASARFCTRLAKAASMSRLVLALRISNCIPDARAAADFTSAIVDLTSRSGGLTRTRKAHRSGQEFVQKPQPLRPRPTATSADTGRHCPPAG